MLPVVRDTASWGRGVGAARRLLRSERSRETEHVRGLVGFGKVSDAENAPEGARATPPGRRRGAVGLAAPAPSPAPPKGPLGFRRPLVPGEPRRGDSAGPRPTWEGGRRGGAGADERRLGEAPAQGPRILRRAGPRVGAPRARWAAVESPGAQETPRCGQPQPYEALANSPTREASGQPEPHLGKRTRAPSLAEMSKVTLRLRRLGPLTGAACSP